MLLADEPSVELQQFEGRHPLVQVSADLGNPAHLDIDDGGRSHAIWVRRHPLRSEPSSWWFLMPGVGLAVELRHGTAISWNGRLVSHCTAIPRGLSWEDKLFSYFMGINASTEAAQQRRREFVWAVEYRQKFGQPPYYKGNDVWVRWSRRYRGGAPVLWRRRTAQILNVGAEVLEVAFYEGKDAGVRSACMYPLGSDDVVLAGRVGGKDMCGHFEGLCGLRVRVYWPGMDKCFPGRVVDYDASSSMHTAHYDDGDVVIELLGGDEAPFYLVCP